MIYRPDKFDLCRMNWYIFGRGAIMCGLDESVLNGGEIHGAFTGHPADRR